MSQYEFDNNQEGDWDENEDIAWNEADWQRFLRNSDKEVSRFISAYNKVKHESDRLDAAAVIMGWHRDDWSSIDDLDFEEDEDILRNAKPLDIDDVRKMDPYTLHRHPVFITATALFSYFKGFVGALDETQPASTRTSLIFGVFVPVWRTPKGTPSSLQPA